MIAKIGPLVEGPLSKKRWLMGHIAGGLVGGALTGMTLGAAGVVASAAFPVLKEFAVPILAISLLIAGMLDLGIVHLRIPVRTRQTPGSWTCSMGPFWGLAAWGFDLGVGLATRPTSHTSLLLPLVSFLSSDVLTATLVMGTFGCLRAVLVVAAVRRAEATATTCSKIYRAKGSLSSATGMFALVLGITNLTGVL